MDLIDMSSRPDEECKWILHLRDHYSKFSWAHALTSKRASEVAAKLVQTFCLFGSPRLLQSDNGKEFVAAVIEELTKAWPGLTIIHGRPRHPQSQGCVERANGDLQRRLGKWLEENEDCGWVLGLQHVMYSMNTSVSATTGKTPYEVVFGQVPRTSCAVLEMLAEQGALNEEDIEDSLIENIDDLAVPMKEKDETTFYRVYTAHGILKNHFSVDDLADMRNVFFPSLENIDTEDLEEISIIQAARKNNSWNASAVKGKTLFSCKGTYITNKCRCKKSGLKCSTKCHISNINICQNRI